MSKDKFISSPQSAFEIEMQLQTMNTRPFSTQRDNLVLTRKKGAKEKKSTAIENPQDGVEEREGSWGGLMRRGRGVEKPVDLGRCER